MVVALLFHGWQRWGLGKGYPYDTFLLSPLDHFSDYYDQEITASLPNPYTDPLAYYLPFAHVAFRLLALLPENAGMIGCFFIALAGLTLLLVKALENTVENPWQRVTVSFLLIVLSYPILFCIDRGNIEIILALCAAGCLYFYSRTLYLAGTLCLLPAICCKIYPVLLLILLVRQRKGALVLSAAFGFMIITLLSVKSFSVSPRTVWDLYGRNMIFFTQSQVYENPSLEESASPWNAYKIGLIAAGDVGLIQPVNFDFDGPLITASYAIYSVCAFALAAFLTVYACFVEKEFHRCAILFLLFISMAVPSGSDYRLLYACIALSLLVQLKSRRPRDLLALVLLSFALIPKKFIFLSFLGNSEIGYPDISIQVILNPLSILTAIALLLNDGCRKYDPTWTARRLRRFCPSWPLRKAQNHASPLPG